MNLFFDRHLSGWDCLKMEMIRRRGAASGSVVEDGEAGAKVSHDLEKNVDMLSDGLAAMV